MPALHVPGSRGIRWRLGGAGFGPFVGGLNLRDTPTELSLQETPASTNWTIDPRGALKWRNGCTNVATLPGNAGTPAFIFYSTALDQWLCARSTHVAAVDVLDVWTRPGDLSGSWTDRGQITSDASSVAAFVDFPGATPKVVISCAHPTGTISNISTWDGTAMAFPAGGGSIAGRSIALWQNRVWVAGFPQSAASGNPARLFASKIGDPTVWAPPDGLSVDIRDKDGSPLTGLGIAGGSLIVFKARSAYRVNDSNTGSYSTIDATAGAQGPLAITHSHGAVYTWGANSIYAWNGVGPGVNVGDKARPLFATNAALVGGVPGLCGGATNDRVVFAYPSSAGGANDRLLEYDPQQGWLMQQQLAGSSKTQISSFAKKNEALYGACRNGDCIFQMFNATPGADDGTAYTATYRTPWAEIFGGYQGRLNRLQVEGAIDSTAASTTLTVNLYKDGDRSAVAMSWAAAPQLLLASASADFRPARFFPRLSGKSFALEFVAGTATSPSVTINSAQMDALLTGLR